MFQNVSFRRKVLLLPALAALGFLVVLVLPPGRWDGMRRLSIA